MCYAFTATIRKLHIYIYQCVCVCAYKVAKPFPAHEHPIYKCCMLAVLCTDIHKTISEQCKKSFRLSETKITY